MPEVKARTIQGSEIPLKQSEPLITSIKGDGRAITLRYVNVAQDAIGYLGPTSIAVLIESEFKPPGFVVLFPQTINGTNSQAFHAAIYESFATSPVLFGKTKIRVSTTDPLIDPIQQFQNSINYLEFEIDGTLKTTSFKPSNQESPDQFQEDLLTIEKQFFISAFSGIFFQIKPWVTVELTLSIAEALNRPNIKVI
jgi:hypothetical protein